MWMLQSRFAIGEFGARIADWTDNEIFTEFAAFVCDFIGDCGATLQAFEYSTTVDGVGQSVPIEMREDKQLELVLRVFGGIIGEEKPELAQTSSIWRR